MEREAQQAVLRTLAMYGITDHDCDRNRPTLGVDPQDAPRDLLRDPQEAVGPKRHVVRIGKPRRNNPLLEVLQRRRNGHSRLWRGIGGHGEGRKQQESQGTTDDHSPHPESPYEWRAFEACLQTGEKVSVRISLRTFRGDTKRDICFLESISKPSARYLAGSFSICMTMGPTSNAVPKQIAGVNDLCLAGLLRMPSGWRLSSTS
jgi:hypothetical protein